MSARLLVAAGLMASAAWAGPHKVAVLVGANAAVAGRGALKFAHDDAKRMASTLVDVAGFARPDVRVLEDPEPDEILAAVDAASAAVEPGADSVFVFYFSGHADPQSLYSNGAPLSLETLKERLESSRAGLRLGIVDACHGQGWTRVKGLVPAPALEVPVVKVLSSQGTALLSASSGLERAHESDMLRGSFFTHHLVAALRGAAEQTPSGEITLQAAYRYAEQRTLRDSMMFAGVAQHPSFDINLHGRADVVLAQLTTAEGGLEVEQHEGPLSLVQLESGLTLLELPAGERRVRLKVEPGEYMLRREQNGDVWAKELNVAAGTTVEIDEEDLALVGQPLLASKAPVELRRIEVSAAASVPLNGSGRGIWASPAISAAISYRLKRWLGFRAFGTYTPFRDETGEPVAVSAQPSAERIGVDALLRVDAQFVPWTIQLGDTVQLELLFAIGTGASITHLVPGGGPTLGWDPVGFGSTVRLTVSDRVAVFLDEYSQWMPFAPQFSLLGLAGLTWDFSVGVSFNL